MATFSGSIYSPAMTYAAILADGKLYSGGPSEERDRMEPDDVVGDKIMYFRGYPEWEVWWADKEDIRDLSDKGVRIGPLNGATLDKPAN
ncbi:MAG: hypothetical protein K2J60_04800 [Acetatifactor sp.]|nr:hypothetical protein [Acetatifactor sp.]